MTAMTKKPRAFNRRGMLMLIEDLVGEQRWFTAEAAIKWCHAQLGWFDWQSFGEQVRRIYDKAGRLDRLPS